METAKALLLFFSLMVTIPGFSQETELGQVIKIRKVIDLNTYMNNILSTLSGHPASGYKSRPIDFNMEYPDAGLQRTWTEVPYYSSGKFNENPVRYCFKRVCLSWLTMHGDGDISTMFYAENNDSSAFDIYRGADRESHMAAFLEHLKSWVKDILSKNPSATIEYFGLK